MERRLSWLEPAGFTVGLVGFVLAAPSGTWDGSRVVLAGALERSASAPLYDLLAGIAAHFPVGEPALRVALLGAVLAAALLAGVIAAARALLPKDPVGGAIAAVVVGLALPGALDTPSILAGCGAVWAVAFALTRARGGLAAIAMCGVVLGAAPWLGVGLAVLVAIWIRPPLLPTLAGLGGLAIALWLGAIGALPGFTPGVPADAIVVGAGGIGAGFAALTGLPKARWLLAAIALAALTDPVAVLALLAIGIAVIPSAIVRVVGPDHRILVALAAGVPLVGAAIATATPAVDPGAAPARLAADLVDALPAGPGVLVETRDAGWLAIVYAQRIAGARPDLALAARTDVAVADALRAHLIAGADVPSLGRLDPLRALPAGRGYQLLGDPVDALAAPLPPPDYASATGAVEASQIALERALLEARRGHLAAAARAAGLPFGAADLAVLAATRPSAERPALFGFVPAFGASPGAWQLALLGDDLAWVGGLAKPAPSTQPARMLHARWRAVLAGEIASRDPSIAALGADAVAATARMLAALHRD